MTDLYRSTNNLGFRIEKRESDGQWVIVKYDRGQQYTVRVATESEVMQWFQLKAALKE